MKTAALIFFCVICLLLPVLSSLEAANGWVAQAGTVPASFFGQQAHMISDWPSQPFGAIRLWDSGIDNSHFAYWYYIETSRGVYDWSTLDFWLSQAANAGVDILYDLSGTPNWASSSPNDSSCFLGMGTANNKGACDPPSDAASGDNVWKDWVTAVVQHSVNSTSGHIKYYELWNEPNLSGYWNGTTAQMVTMAQDAYSIIHNLDPNAMVVSPCPSTSGNPLNQSIWFSGYFIAGGTIAQDIIAYHAYPTTAGGDPETYLLTQAYAIQTQMSQHGIGNLPLWSTENSWGNTGSLTGAQEAAWLAKSRILALDAGLQRSYWYSWDSNFQGGIRNDTWGQLWDAATGVHQAGQALGQVYNWLVGGNTFNPFCTNGGDDTWSCLINEASGKHAQIIWNSNTAKTITVDKRFSSCVNLDGSPCAITNTQINIGPSPVLLLMDAH